MVNVRTSPGRRRARGFTLIEVMVSSGLLLFLLGSTMNVLIATNNSTERVRRIGNTQEVARLALDALASDIASAGLGVGNGRIGTVPGTLTTAWWVPAIYSGPDITVLEPGGRSTIITNSIYIVGAEPASMGLGYAGTGKQGVVLSSTSGTPLSITCSNAGGTGVGCDTTDLDSGGKVVADPLIPATLPPLLIGDFSSGIYITPTSLQAGVPPTMTLDY